VLALFWWTSLQAELEYRMNFVLAALSSLGHLVGNWFALGLFYQGGASLGGWRFEAALLVLGLFTTLQGLIRTWLTPNLTRLVEHVRTGTLDFVLLKPLDSQLWLSARRLSPWGIPDGLFGAAIVIYASLQLDVQGRDVLRALVPLACSVVILYSMWFTLASISIWYVKVYNVTEVLNGFLAAGRYPIDALPPGLYRFVFSFVIPVLLLTTLPARVLMGQAVGWEWFASCVAFAFGAFLSSRSFFRFALRFYSSASS
jgi:ABC-2 type transport system permease protein